MENDMKKIIAILAMICMLCMLAACVDHKEETTDTGDELPTFLEGEYVETESEWFGPAITP